MIELRGVAFTYPGADAPAIGPLDLRVAEGDLLLVAGPSGSGKSTLLRTLNGLVPHYSGGTLRGRLIVAGREVTGLAPRELADVVGFVPQDPWAYATADRVTAEIVFAMENLGSPLARMRKRLEEVLDQLGLAELRDRQLDTLSGGERQRVAIAAVLAAQPRVLVCDEPTSNLDPQSAEEVLSTLARLRDELGLTVVIAEHRLDRVAAFADRVAWLPGPGEPPVTGGPREVFARAAFAPPVTELGRALGWSPLPLTVREARGFARGLGVRALPRPHPQPPRKLVLRAHDIAFAYDGTPVLRGVSLELRAGELAVLVGRNGAGKTTLLRVLAGLARPDSGLVETEGAREAARPRRWQRRRGSHPAGEIAFVPQRAESLLLRERLGDELRAAGPYAEALALRFGLDGLEGRSVWALSAGQRLRAALAVALAAPARAVLLDEPTRGLDPPGKRALADALHDRARAGAAVLLVTHDVELAAAAADRVILLAEGRVVADGPTREVLGESLLFSSSTSKAFDDPDLLVPDDVLEAVQER